MNAKVKLEDNCVLKLFEDDLPYKPYCTDRLGFTNIRIKDTAVKRKYIQYNQPEKVSYLVFDIDREYAVFAWYDENLPAPAWTARNPDNGRAHLAYRLKVPVCTSNAAHVAPMKYLAAIESALTEKLKADKSFAGLLTKNPLNPYWVTKTWTEHEYELDELADYLDLKGHPKLRDLESVGLGRNCELFESTRKWAYAAIRDFWQPSYWDKWNNAVYDAVEARNDGFANPLPISEVKAISKSIARWTYREFTPSKFRASQAKVGAKGGKLSKGGGRPVNADSIEQIKPWVKLGISRRTYFNRKKAGTL